MSVATPSATGSGARVETARPAVTRGGRSTFVGSSGARAGQHAHEPLGGHAGAEESSSSGQHVSFPSAYGWATPTASASTIKNARTEIRINPSVFTGSGHPGQRSPARVASVRASL